MTTIGGAGAAARNVGLKIGRRMMALHKPFVRATRRADRVRAFVTARRVELRSERDIAAVAAGHLPIVVGPWLSEVGYEVLYWIPFLRWFEHTYRIAPERVIAVSRGGVSAWYAGLASTYVDLFDVFTPAEFAARNAARRSETEGGGQKQSSAGGFDADILDRLERRTGAADFSVCHPALMFRLFREFWLGNQAFDFLWRHTTYARMTLPPATTLSLPPEYTAVKFYTGTAVPPTDGNRRAVRAMIAALAATRPVVLLDTGLSVDEHEDYRFDDMPNVSSLRASLTPSTNLGVQAQVMASSRQFVGTCGSLAWLAPLLGVPTIAVYADDRLLTTHLTVARQAYRATDAASFATIDLRALDYLHLFNAPAA